MVGHIGRTLIIAITLTCGCNNGQGIRHVASSLVAQPDSTVELLESELRWMEDNLYHLDAQLERSQQQLESTRRTNAALRLELAKKEQTQATRSPNSGSSGLSSPRSGGDERYDEEKIDDTDELFDFTPKVELGGAQSSVGSGIPSDGNQEPLSIPERRIPDQDPSFQPQGAPPVIESLENPLLDDEEQGDEAAAESGQVIRIQLNERLTGGFNSDRRPGHDGVMVVIEPQDAHANYIPAPGTVTIEVREKNESGVAGLVGKWNFTREEIKARTRQTLMGKGIHLELPWPQGSPTTEQLELAVQYTTDGGRQLRASRQILIEPTTSALTTQTDAARQSWYSGRRRTASHWKPTR